MCGRAPRNNNFASQAVDELNNGLLLHPKQAVNWSITTTASSRTSLLELKQREHVFAAMLSEDSSSSSSSGDYSSDLLAPFPVIGWYATTTGSSELEESSSMPSALDYRPNLALANKSASSDQRRKRRHSLVRSISLVYPILAEMRDDQEDKAEGCSRPLKKHCPAKNALTVHEYKRFMSVTPLDKIYLPDSGLNVGRHLESETYFF